MDKDDWEAILGLLILVAVVLLMLVSVVGLIAGWWEPRPRYPRGLS
jgi:hypothetical protein